MNENLSPEVREATVANFFNEKVYVIDPFGRTQEHIPLDWEAVAKECYDPQAGFSTVPVRMADETEGWLTVACKDEMEDTQYY